MSEENTNISDAVSEAKKQKYIKITIGVFVFLIILLLILFFTRSKTNNQQISDKTGFINIEDNIKDKQSQDNNTKNNTNISDTNDDNDIEEEGGEWEFYNILSDENVILSQSTKEGIVFLQRNFIGKKTTNNTDKNKYTLKILLKDDITGNNVINIKIDFNDIARSWSINNDFTYIFINGDKLSNLYKVDKKQNSETGQKEFYLDNIGEINNTMTSVIQNNILYFVRTENNINALYKMNFKDLKEQKLINIPIKNFDLYTVNNNIYLKSKIYTNNKQLILKYNNNLNKFETFSNLYQEEKNFDEAKLINDKDNISLEYGIDQNLKLNIKTTLQKCNAGEGYIFCGFSNNYNNIESWLKKDMIYRDKIYIYDLTNKKSSVLNVYNHTLRQIDIDDIYINNNNLYFKDRNTGSFIELNLEILNYIDK